MRSFFNGLARGVFAVSIVLALAAPVDARPVPRDGSWGRERAPILKILKRFAVRLFGDGLVDPKPTDPPPTPTP